MSNGLSTIDSILAEVLKQPVANDEDSSFIPHEPDSLANLNIPVVLVQNLILKYLLNTGEVTGRQIALQMKLPTHLTVEFLREMKEELLVAYKRASGLNDYLFELTEKGHALAKRTYEQRTYYGAVPVSLAEYRKSIELQSPNLELPKAAELRQALQGLTIAPEMFNRLGQAISSVGAVFLYGPPGNGKTSIAERLTSAFSSHVWIPRSISIEGEIVRLFDPMVHTEVANEEDEDQYQGIDRRWVLVERPTVVVGGELKMEHLELIPDKATGVIEAPVQLKSNTGTLVIDDFGRQQMSTDELLNRWIIPLEKKYDFLNTPSGKKIQVPFEQLVVFATNLEPRELVDEAFLRRIPYKIRSADPTEQDLRELFPHLAQQMDISCSDEIVTYLIDTHFKAANREMRFCHARDLLLQVKSHCHFLEQESQLTKESVDAAVANYFSIM